MSATVIRYRDATSVSDFVYLRGEVIYDSVAGTLAVSDGVTAWSALPKFSIAGGGLVDGTYGDVTISGGGTVMTVGSGVLAVADISGLTAALAVKEDNWTYLSLVADFTTSSATAVDVTGLAFAPAASTNYEFEIMLLLRTATGTVGACPGLSWPTGMTDGVVRLFASSALNAEIIRHGNISASVLVANTGASSTTTSFRGGGKGEVFAGASPSGNVQVQLASETGGTTVTVKAMSFLRYRIIP